MRLEPNDSTLAQNEVWSELREAEAKLRSMAAEGTPSAPDLWRKFGALHRRLRHEPPAGKSETVQRLKAIRDQCAGEFEQFRPAVEKALTIADQRDGW